MFQSPRRHWNLETVARVGRCKGATNGQEINRTKIFMIRQRLEAHLKAEGHDVHDAKGQEEPALKPICEENRYQDEPPFQAKRKAKALARSLGCKTYGIVDRTNSDTAAPSPIG